MLVNIYYTSYMNNLDESTTSPRTFQRQQEEQTAVLVLCRLCQSVRGRIQHSASRADTLKAKMLLAPQKSDVFLRTHSELQKNEVRHMIRHIYTVRLAEGKNVGCPKETRVGAIFI